MVGGSGWNRIALIEKEDTQTIQPSLVEIDAESRVVWKLKENKEIGRISAVAVYPLSKQLKKLIKQAK